MLPPCNGAFALRQFYSSLHAKSIIIITIIFVRQVPIILYSSIIIFIVYFYVCIHVIESIPQIRRVEKKKKRKIRMFACSADVKDSTVKGRQSPRAIVIVFTPEICPYIIITIILCTQTQRVRYALFYIYIYALVVIRWAFYGVAVLLLSIILSVCVWVEYVPPPPHRGSVAGM